MNYPWLRRRWYEFRLGHSVYLIFALSFANFILIFHRLLIERVPVLDAVFSELWLFAIVFFLAYVPISILVGLWHRKTQLKVDVEQSMRQNLLMAQMLRVILDIQTGEATKDEIEKMRKMLRKIEEGKG